LHERRKNQTAEQRQRSIFKYIKDFLLENGFPPSVREIGSAVGLRSSSTVHAYLDMLEDRGLIVRDPAKPRAIDILDEKHWRNNVQIPVVYKITVPDLLFEEENIETRLKFPVEFVVDTEQSFMMRAEDDSMSDAGIAEGDYVLVYKKSEVVNGDIVVVLLADGKAVIRYYQKDSKGVRLSPAHAKMRGSYVKAGIIIGKATGVYRCF